MNEQTIILSEIRNRYSKTSYSDRSPKEIFELVKEMSDVLAVGEYYYYVTDVVTQEIEECHPHMLGLHGLTRCPKHLQEIKTLIHPDDVHFVKQAEMACMHKMRQIDPSYIANLKSSYSMRLRTSNNVYGFFHYQAIPLEVDKGGNVKRTLNIHSNISHITQINNYHAYITGIFGHSHFYDLNVFDQDIPDRQAIKLTKRELDIIHCIAKGMSSEIIALQLQISLHTVREHRKNILTKLDVNNSVAMIRRCSRMGYL